MVNGNNGCFLQAHSLPVLQICDLGLVWKYFEVRQNTWKLWLKKTCLQNKLQDYRKSSSVNFLGLWFNEPDPAFFPWGEADLDHNRESLADKLANSMPETISGKQTTALKGRWRNDEQKQNLSLDRSPFSLTIHNFCKHLIKEKTFYFLSWSYKYDTINPRGHWGRWWNWNF